MPKASRRYWNYRIILDPSRGGFLGLYEVHYEGDRPVAWEATPTTFVAGIDEGVRGITGGLRLASKAGRRPVLMIVRGKRKKERLVELSDPEFKALVREAKRKLTEQASRARITRGGRLVLV